MAHRWASLVQGDQISGRIRAPVGQGSSGTGQRSDTAMVFSPVITTPLQYFILGQLLSAAGGAALTGHSAAPGCL